MDILNESFCGCNAMLTITSLIKEPFDIAYDTFVNYEDRTSRSFFFDPNKTLYVPAGTKALYENRKGWKEFANIVEMEPTEVKTISDGTSAAEIIARYDVSGRSISKLQHGLNFLRMSDGTVKKVFVR